MMWMVRVLSPSAVCSLPSSSSSFPILSRQLCLSCRRHADIDRKDERPEAYHLEHVQQRLAFTTPLMFKQRLDYTFYRKDVFLDDQVFSIQRQGLPQLMQHFGTISVLSNFFLPHVEMEATSCVPMLEEGSVRLRWRVKYVSFPRLLLNPKLFRYEYRLKNLSWLDGNATFLVDGNGDVFRITITRVQRDDGFLKAPTQKLAEKIGVLPRSPATNFVPQRRREKE